MTRKDIRDLFIFLIIPITLALLVALAPLPAWSNPLPGMACMDAGKALKFHADRGDSKIELGLKENPNGKGRVLAMVFLDEKTGDWILVFFDVDKEFACLAGRGKKRSYKTLLPKEAAA